MSSNVEMQRLGAEVRRRREGLGVSIATFAAMARLSPNFIGGIERGERDPSVSTIQALARGLGCHAADLLGGTPEMSAAATEAARLFDEAPVDVQDAVMHTLRTLSKRCQERT